ncbi:MAG: S8 family serine peptidase [Acidimicrobiia bacterium]|nr:S8 family serine peptidase [Acidimicrobiia bacterium]
MAGASRGLSWDGESPRPSKTITTTAVLGMLAAMILSPSAAFASDDMSTDVIVRETAPETDAAERLISTLGGTVGEQLDVIGGFAATVPTDKLAGLAGHPAVEAVTPDATVTLLDNPFGRNSEPVAHDLTLTRLVQTVGADVFWAQGHTGKGVDVALIDSGVVAVDGLLRSEVGGPKVINGPDLSFESQSDKFRWLDTYGHGTHMAGIIAGHDNAAAAQPSKSSETSFNGIAPNARILSVKVASHDGAVDVSQVIAAIDWVVQHKNDNGMNVRVLNLSFGTDSTQSYVLDPLAHAAEQAWRAGIVVVVAAGNDGNWAQLRNPARNPNLIAVGASNPIGTLTLADDYVASFSNCEHNARTVDVLAPGVSIVSLRNPGSYADSGYPSGQVGTRFFKGTGTSQATAVVSGAAALILSKFPDATPQQVKDLLMTTAYTSARGKAASCYGAGSIDLSQAARLTQLSRTFDNQTWSTGTGSLEASRGSDHLTHNGRILAGEYDIFGMPFDAAQWANLASRRAAWSDGYWNGSPWTGVSWSGVSWSGVSWSGVSWSGVSWSDKAWEGGSWSGVSWSGVSWSGVSWSGGSWSGIRWR